MSQHVGKTKDSTTANPVRQYHVDRKFLRIVLTGVYLHLDVIVNMGSSKKMENVWHRSNVELFQLKL
ncbi:hypothetical protein JTB14_023336 [Gonioctena quinquepunctata]|nr:hypothetical protein JTB14_023336 [Gonioctena quinquepunctata]